VVVMDMHEPFRQAVELCLPRAKVVADKFHLLMHVHRARLYAIKCERGCNLN